jgi:chain length determinant protein (polysaccharide antigen chain regulator)
MVSKTVEQPMELRPVPVYLADLPGKETEVGLADLWSAVVRRKWLALLGFGITLLLTLIYLYLAEPVYRATAYLLPPQQQNIQGLLIDVHESGSMDINVDSYTPDYVFNIFLNNLRSQGLRREFFELHKLINYYVSAKDTKNINEDRVFETRFNENLRVKANKDTPPMVSVSFSNTDPKLTAQWTNQFIDFANDRTIEQLFGDVNASLQAEIKRIRDRLSSKLQLAKQRRLDRIAILKEALRVAEALGIEETGTLPFVKDKTLTGMAVNTAQVPLYMRGANALKTEISVIETRKSDEPFVSEFRDLQEQLTFLEAISIDPASLSTVTVDGPARVPYKAEKPNRIAVAVLGVVLGIVAGVFLALAAESLFGVINRPGK